MSSEFFRVKKGLNISPSDSSTVTSPEVGDIIIDSSDNNKLKRYDDVTSSWKDVGSGVGGINYISNNSDFEGGTVGYAPYADVAGEAPVDGTGGTATFVSIGTDSVSPLRGTKSGLISKTANNAQGQGVSYDFTIDAADQAQVLRISFDYNTEASTTNYADGDIRVYVYDVTNSRLIEVIDRDLLASSKGKFVGTFQTSPDSLSYRLIFHIAGTGTTAWTVKIDNVIVGPQTIVKGAIVTDWEAFTPTFSENTNVTYSGFYRRMGSDLEMSLKAVYSGAGPSHSLTMTLPFGLQIDPNALAPSTDAIHILSSEGNFYDASAAATANMYLLGAFRLTSNAGFRVQVFNNNDWQQFNPGGVPVVTASGDQFILKVKVPIQGWSSNVVLSEDAGNREIYARLDMNNVNQNGTAIGQTLVALSNASEDTTGSFDSATSLWTCPESGLYDIIGSIYATGVTTTDNNACSIRINGSGVFATFNQPGNSTAANTIVCSITYRLQKGDTVGLAYTSQTDAAYVINGNTGRTFLSIAKRSSPQTIAASEVVACRYTSNSGLLMVNGTNTPLTFNLKEFDTHNAFDGTTFTAPQSGYYQICENVQFGGNTAGVGIVRIWGTTSVGTSIQGDYFGISASIQSATMSKIIYLPKGGTIATSILQSNGANRALVTDSSRNSIEIIKVG